MLTWRNIKLDDENREEHESEIFRLINHSMNSTTLERTLNIKEKKKRTKELRYSS